MANILARASGRVEQGALLAFELRRRAHADTRCIQSAARGVREKRVLRMKLRELPLHHAADEDHRKHPLAGFVRAQDVDHVAASVLEPQRFQAQHRFRRPPIFRHAHQPLRVERLRRFLEGFIQKIQHRRLAPPFQSQRAFLAPLRAERDETDCAACGTARPNPPASFRTSAIPPAFEENR